MKSFGYTVRITDNLGCTLVDTYEILPGTALDPILNADLLSGFVPMTVHFDFTCDKAVSWIWNFGVTLRSDASCPVTK